MITEATLEDVPHLCDLLDELFTQESDFRADRAKQSAGLRLIIENPDFGRIFTVRHEGTIAAMVNLLFIVSIAHGGRMLLLEDLIVCRRFRNQGIATSLLRHAIRFAQSIDAVQTVLLTDNTNLKAIRLYEKAGFARAGSGPVRKPVASGGEGATRSSDSGKLRHPFGGITMSCHEIHTLNE